MALYLYLAKKKNTDKRKRQRNQNDRTEIANISKDTYMDEELQ